MGLQNFSMCAEDSYITPYLLNIKDIWKIIIFYPKLQIFLLFVRVIYILYFLCTMLSIIVEQFSDDLRNDFKVSKLSQLMGPLEMQIKEFQ